MRFVAMQQAAPSKGVDGTCFPDKAMVNKDRNIEVVAETILLFFVSHFQVDSQRGVENLFLTGKTQTVGTNYVSSTHTKWERCVVWCMVDMSFSSI